MTELDAAIMITISKATLAKLEEEARVRGMGRSAHIRKVLAWYLYLQKQEAIMPKKSPRKFTAKQTAFIEAWDGNASKAAKTAGYCNPRQSAYDLLQNPYISDAIKNREALQVTEKVMTENMIREFWTQVARDTGHDIKDRLTACKLLAKAKGMFIQKVEHTGDVDHYHHGELPEALTALLDRVISGRGDEEGQGLHPLPHRGGAAREAA